MGNITRFAAINTKVKVLEGKLLNNQDYVALLAKKDVGEVVTYLKESTTYKEVLKNIGNSIEVDTLEWLLQKNIVKQYEKLVHYFTGEYRKLFKIIFMRYEISDLKLYLKTVIRGEDLSKAREMVIGSTLYRTMNYERLEQSKNLEEFVEHLRDTAYYSFLKPYLAEEPEKRLFYMEMVLDKLYFKHLAEQVDRLNLQDRKIFKEFLGKNIDLLNLQWIYRGLKFYRLSPEELINYTLYGGYALNYSTLKNICYSKNEKELIQQMMDSKYGFLFDNEDTREIFMERRIKRYLYFLLLEYKKRSQMNIIHSVAYRHLLEFEMRDIISIIEAIKYGLDPKHTKTFLIRKIREEGA
ncbi:V-type ATPase subunit [Clostridiaceae bacterium 35-E11]